MNIFLSKWDYNDKDNLEIAKRLESAGHKIVYWVGTSREDVSEPGYRNFPHTIFHNVFKAILGKPAEKFADLDFAPPGEEFIKNFHETESILSTIKQFEKSKTSVLGKKNLYHNYLEYWHGAIKKLKPEVIIFAICPHTGYDFVIFSLAKFFNIKTIIFEYTGIADRHIIYNDYIIGSGRLREEIEANKDKNFTIDNLSSDIKEYYLSQAGGGNNAYQRFKRKYGGLNLLRIKFKLAARSIKDFSLFIKIYLYLSKKFGRNLRKEYIKTQSQAYLDRKFIYLALHLQPECATAPLGGVFVDQILMIKILAYALPAGWVIYVKEHPVHWLAQGINYTSFRYPGYYEDIAKIKKVKIVPAETPAEELINKSQAIATVTGTVGREALMRFKPVLIFGYPSYRDCPGVFKVNGVESCQEALAKINSGFKVKEQEIINYFVSLDKVSFHTYFEKLQKDKSKLSAEEHIAIMVKVIKEELAINNNL